MKQIGEQAKRERELLLWQERQLAFRKKYGDSPAGFQSREAEEQAVQDLKAAWKDFEDRNTYRLLADYVPEDEGFAGRGQYLAEMEQLFSKGQSPVVLYGIAGIGKTALARAYVRRHREDYDTVLFLPGNTSLMELICDDSQVPISNLQYSQDQYGSKRRYWNIKMKVLRNIAESRRLLLIIDDCSAEEDRKLRELAALPCHILITTRRNPAVWTELCQRDFPGIWVRELDTDAEWKEFIQVYRGGDLDPEAWRDFVQYREKVKGHTLLMVRKLCGGTADETGMEFSRDLFSRFSLKKVERQALRELAVMPEQGIPESLFYQVSETPERSVERLVDDLLVRREQIVGQDGEDFMLSLHPLVAEAVKEIYSPTLEKCRRLIWGFYRKVWNTWHRTARENQELEPYVLALLESFPHPVAWLARPLEEFVTFLWMQGHFQEAEAYCKKIVACVEAEYGFCHQTTAEMYLRMAAVYDSAMESAKAEEWYWKGCRAICACQPLDKRYHVIRCTAHVKIARLHRYHGYYEEAMKQIDAALLAARKFGLGAARGGGPWNLMGGDGREEFLWAS